MLLIRVILPLCIFGGLIWAHVRISIALRKRLDIPADMKATMNALTHQVSEYDESLKRHLSKHAGRDRLKAKAEEKAAAEAPTPVAGTIPQPKGGIIPAEVWRDAGQAQQMVWQDMGLRPAG